MEEITVIVQKNVTDYLGELILVLYQNEYFGFESDAQIYVQKIYDFIEQNISVFPHRRTPEKLSDLGSKYIFYKANPNTTWYIFFENNDSRFLVTFITNNHSEIVKFF